MEQVSPSVFVETGYLGANVSCIITPPGLVLIDCPLLPHEARHWRRQLENLKAGKILYLINTDHHFDHCFTSSLFTKNTITHLVAVKGIKYLETHLKDEFMNFYPHLYDEVKEELKEVEIIPPHLTFSKELRLQLGGKAIELEFVGGHSPATLSIYFPEEEILFTGDNLETAYPFMGQARYATWIAFLTKIKTMKIARIVPGHGNVSGPELIDKFLDFFDAMRGQVEKFKSEGLSAEETARRVDLMGYFPIEPGSEDLVKKSIVQGVMVMYQQIW